MKTNPVPTSSPSAPFQSEERHVRTCRFTPYRKGCGPTFTLRIWETYARDWLGKHVLAYQLTARENGKTSVLFDGADYACAPGSAIDSDVCVENLMSFLTIRPGDTDSEYFDNYTEVQKAYCEEHAEMLGAEVQARFCDEDGRVIRA